MSLEETLTEGKEHPQAIDKIVTDRAIYELKEAHRILKEMEDSPVMRLKMLCESMATICMCFTDETGRPSVRGLQTAYGEFCLAALSKAQSLL